MAEHKDILQDGIHIPHFRKVATYDSLQNEIVDNTDLDKIALVVDTGAYYRLDVISPISWVKIANTPTELNQYLALKVSILDVKDNLISEDTDKPLSANQGKVLQDAKANKNNPQFNGDIELLESDKGIILKSIGGIRYRLTVDDLGNLETEAL